MAAIQNFPQPQNHKGLQDPVCGDGDRFIPSVARLLRPLNQTAPSAGQLDSRQHSTLGIARPHCFVTPHRVSPLSRTITDASDAIASHYVLLFFHFWGGNSTLQYHFWGTRVKFCTQGSTRTGQ